MFRLQDERTLVVLLLATLPSTEHQGAASNYFQEHRGDSQETSADTDSNQADLSTETYEEDGYAGSAESLPFRGWER